MLFQIVQPFQYDIYGDSFKEAIKNYVKFKHNSNITNLIIKDQNSNMFNTKLNYYKKNKSLKVGIDVYPYTNISYPLTPIVPTNLVPLAQTNMTPFNNPINMVPFNNPINMVPFNNPINMTPLNNPTIYIK